MVGILGEICYECTGQLRKTETSEATYLRVIW